MVGVSTVLIANRGEIACRIIRSARKLGVRTVAVYSECDAESPHVEQADLAVALPGQRAAETYMDQDKLLEIAREHGVALVHPGYGFLAENANFARRCVQSGLVFVGPSPETIASMGDKATARVLAANAGARVLAGSERASLADPATLAKIGRRTGFPLLVKAAAGGGGIGMRRVDSEAELVTAAAAASQLAGKYFGDDGVYLERYVADARHVEVQIFGFGDGTAIDLFDRDCSLQRRHQKIVEEAPAPDLPDEAREEMIEAALSIARSISYAGAGTVEFLYDPHSRACFFLEMNTRIQVEHPVTEMITGSDLVAAQLKLAMGASPRDELEAARSRREGHAIEARIYAEDPARKFQPSPGLIEALVLPAGPGIRIDSGYASGNRITPFYDPMMMKVAAFGATRAEAIVRLIDALDRIEIAGPKTNLDFLRYLLRQPEVANTGLHTQIIDSLVERYLEQMAVGG